MDAILHGYVIPSNQWALPGLGVCNDQVEGYPYNPDKAAVQGYLEKVGIQLEPNPATVGSWVEMTSGGGWDGIINLVFKTENDVTTMMLFMGVRGESVYFSPEGMLLPEFFFPRIRSFPWPADSLYNGTYMTSGGRSTLGRRWYEIAARAAEEAVEAIADLFHEQGANGVAIEESGTLNRRRDTSLGQWYDRPLNDIPEGEAVIKGYFADSADPDALVRTLREKAAELGRHGIATGDIRWEVGTVDEEDWADSWKRYYKPLHISDRLTVKPTWEPYEPRRDGEIVIEMDPGMAFGTGAHATTALCLRALERVVRPGDRVLDIGTGSGILAVASARLGASRVIAFDLDPVAVSSARENARLNGLDDVVTVLESDLLAALKDMEKRGEKVRSAFDVAVANILAEVIVQFVDEVREALAPGGRYVASGIIAEKEAMVRGALERAGFEIEGTEEREGWIALVARRPAAQGNGASAGV